VQHAYKVWNDNLLCHTFIQHPDYQDGKTTLQLASLESTFQMICDDFCFGGKDEEDVGQLGCKG
jgi:hypothetical protein